jgi:hypothetical protein
MRSKSPLTPGFRTDALDNDFKLFSVVATGPNDWTWGSEAPTKSYKVVAG